MAQFYENFNGATVGAGHPDFSVLWGDLGISVESTSIVAGSDAHLLLSHVSGTYLRNAVQWTKATTSGKTIVRALVEFQNHDSGVPGSISGPLLSGTGDDATRAGYVQWFRRSHAISRYEAGSDASAVETTDAFPLGEQGDIVQRYVEIIRDGSLIEVREWKLAEERPTTADLSFTDASPLPVSGAVGLSHLSSGTASSPNMRVYEVQVATDGDALPGGPILPTARKGSQFTVDKPGTLGTITTATLNAVNVFDHLTAQDATTATFAGAFTDEITTSGEYALVLGDGAVTETITIQVNVVGLPSNTLKKAGSLQINLADVKLAAFNASDTLVDQRTALTTDGAGVVAPVDMSSLSEAVGDTLTVSLYSASAATGITFVQALELI